MSGIHNEITPGVGFVPGRPFTRADHVTNKAMDMTAHPWTENGYDRTLELTNFPEYLKLFRRRYGASTDQDLPDVNAVVVPWGGGGLTCGIASATRELRSACKIFTAEVATAAPLAASLAAGAPVEIDYQPSWVDGIGAKAVFPQMFDRARKLIDGAFVANLPSIANALRLLVQHNHIVAEGAGACPVACALSGYAASGKIVCIISGGNIDPAKLARILTCEL